MPHMWFSVQQMKKQKPPYCIWLTGLMALREEVFREEGGGAKNNNNKMKNKTSKPHCLPDTFGFSPPGKLLDKNWLSLLALCMRLCPRSKPRFSSKTRDEGWGWIPPLKARVWNLFPFTCFSCLYPLIRCTWGFSAASVHHLVLIVLICQKMNFLEL